MSTPIDELILLPQPRRVKGQDGILTLRHGARIVCQGEPQLLLPVAAKLQEAMWETQGMEWSLWAGSAEGDSLAQAVLVLDTSAQVPTQGYRLQITPQRISVTASEPAGLFYGVMTLKQILRQCAGELPCCEINDHPDFASRGVMLDISRDKVPTLETLFALVDELAEWKINHLELYTEHTFAYRNHREVWAQASPMTGEDILRLDAYCRERFVELVPNQNSFGHMHRWLRLPRYRHLAECPDGFDWPWGGHSDEPFSLDPTNPESLQLIAGLYEELLPHFSSRKFNVGCDETFDLGQGASREECERKGKGRVYLEFLLRIYELVKRHGRTMHFWGDIIMEHPELVPELPKDVVALEWGYEATHPFDEHGAKFAASGIPFYVCPGTSSWNTIAGRTDNCLGNLRNAAENGLKHGAIGYLNTDWGDNGHWQYLPVSYLGFAAGAAFSWCYTANHDIDIVRALDVHVFRDDAEVMGRLAYDLGNAYQKVGHLTGNSSLLFHFLHAPLTAPLPEGVTEETIRATMEYIRNVTEPLIRARMDRADATLIVDEFANAARMLLHGCRRALAVRSGVINTVSERRDLAVEMRAILGEHRRLWMARNREGGLQDSTRVLEQRLKEYEA
ncbi:MAG: glycoside hydrolase family 20 zincin-like fold domain-containing protein [Armatimonadota bacterium]|nr:family 20 glycosylhydrolase [bacterium]MDW8320356.1 glycoside hydrolase family 20 zincin-like fold domain-containing protein [Armatimonadota bacterium]